jgi:hypothetical protein
MESNKKGNEMSDSNSTEKRALHAYLDVGAYERFSDFASNGGVSVSGLLQAIGQNLDGKSENINLNSLLLDARSVDSDRRKRPMLRKGNK